MTRPIGLALVLIAAAVASTAPSARGQAVVEIVDPTGDGTGNALDAPQGVAVARCGTVYVACSTSDNVFRISPAGVVTQVLDSNGDGAGSPLFAPQDVALDAAGNLYVAGAASDNVFRVAVDGTVTEIVDATGDGAGNVLDQPWSVAVDAAGNVLVAGRASHNAFRVTPAGTVTEIVDASGDGAGNPLASPWDVAADGLDAVISGRDSDNVFRVASDGTVTRILDATGDGAGNPLDGPVGVAVGASGDVIVASSVNNRVFRIASGGAVTRILDVAGDGTHLAFTPLFVAVGEDERVYVACGGASNNAFAIEPGGAVQQIVDATGDGQGNTLFVLWGVAVQPGTGHVFVSGLGSDNVFRIEGPAAFPSFCDASDGALASCPCGASFQGLPTTGCDAPIPAMQGGGLTGGVRLDVLRQSTAPENRATLCGTGFPTLSFPGVTVIRAPTLSPVGPITFGDGVRCIGPTVTRLGAHLAQGGTYLNTIGHGSMAGTGSFYYQLWVRSTPTSFCDPFAAFNLSNGREIVW